MTYHPDFSRLKNACLSFIQSSVGKAPEELEFSFNALALDLFRFQFEHNLPYQAYCKSRGASPEQVKHWEQIPPLITTAWKELELSVLRPEEREFVFFSSGTTNQKRGRHFHSLDTVEVYEQSLIEWFRPHLLDEGDGATFLFLSPRKEEAPNSSLVHMFETVQKIFGEERSAFAATTDKEGAWNLDFPKIETILKEAGANGKLIVMGTAFSFVHLCDYLAQEKRKWHLPPGSKVMETGGYKGRSRTLEKRELHQLISSTLNLPLENIICEYGMSELSSQAYDSPKRDKERTFRFPAWAKTRIVSPETGREVKSGETGLLQVFDLANIGSVMALQTEDLARKTRGGFELLGRAAEAEPRGCSLMNL